MSLIRNLPATDLAKARFSRAEVDARGRVSALRAPGGQCSVLLLAIDDVRLGDEVSGRSGGGRRLRWVADVLRRNAGAGVVAHPADGYKFAILRTNDTLADAVAWADDFRNRVAATTVPAGAFRLPLSVSMGVANRSADASYEELIAEAEGALALAQALGRNRLCTWKQVRFREELARVGDSVTESPQGKLYALLGRESVASALGPTQRDHLTAHAVFVCRLALWLGRALRMDRHVLRRLEIAGLCHDLGKFLIPEEVLAKSAPLTTAERRLLTRHAADGAEMARWLGADRETSDYIRFHHNRYDGTRPEDTLKGTQIPLGARVLAVADAFVTMTSERPYRAARTVTSAAHELRRESGAQFDPAVVAALPGALLSRVPEVANLRSQAEQ